MTDNDSIDRYYKSVTDQLQTIYGDQRAALETAADWLSRVLTEENWLYVFGTGHSHMLAEEVFYRAGGLVRAIPILDDRLMLHQSASRSTDFERDETFGRQLIERYSIKERDLVIIASNSGRNAVPIDLAHLAKERGAKTIGIVNRAHAETFPSRHTSGRGLIESVDLVIDNAGVPGDATLQLEGMPGATGATSSITGIFIIQTIVVRAIEKCVQSGTLPEIYLSSNGANPGHNDAIIERHKTIPHL